MSLTLDQTFVGFFHEFSAIFTPAQLAGRTNCKLKVLWLGWCHIAITGSRWPISALCPTLLGAFSRATLSDSKEFTLHYVSSSPLKCTQFQSSLSILSPHISPIQSNSSCSHPNLSLSIHGGYYFSFTWEILSYPPIHSAFLVIELL